MSEPLETGSIGWSPDYKTLDAMSEIISGLKSMANKEDISTLSSDRAVLLGLVRKLRDALTCADRDLAETAVTTGYRMRNDTAQKMTHAFARADKLLAGEKSQEGKLDETGTARERPFDGQSQTGERPYSWPQEGKP